MCGLCCDTCDPRPKFPIKGTQPYQGQILNWLRFVRADSLEEAETEALRIVSAQSGVPTEQLTIKK